MWGGAACSLPMFPVPPPMFDSSDIGSFLRSFERYQQALQVPPAEWVFDLSRYLSGTDKIVLSELQKRTDHS